MSFPLRCPLRQLVLALSLGAVAGLTPAQDLPTAEDALETSAVEAPSEGMPPASGPASSASAPAPGEPVAPDEWKAWNGRYFRLDETGDVQCYSEDGEHCSLNRPNPALARPIRCAKRQAHPLRHIIPEIENIYGYEQSDHWCNNAYANLFATWTNYQPLGYPVVLSTNPRGDVMCKSFDATTCLAPGEHGPLAPKQLKPVVCGRAMAQWTGFSGYVDPDHWCSSPELVRRIKAPQGDTIHVSSGGKLLSKKYQLTLPGWDAREQPTWIVRFTMPHPDRSGIRLDAQGKLMSWTPEQHYHSPSFSRPPGGYDRHASIEMTGEQRPMLIDDFATNAASRVPVLSRKGRGQLALRIDDPGRVRFFQGDGWHRKGLMRLDLDGDGRLLPLYYRVRWPESKTMTLTITTSLWAPDGSQRLSMSDLRRAPLPELHDILLTRKRPPRRSR